MQLYNKYRHPFPSIPSQPSYSSDIPMIQNQKQHIIQLKQQIYTEFVQKNNNKFEAVLNNLNIQPIKNKEVFYLQMDQQNDRDQQEQNNRQKQIIEKQQSKYKQYDKIVQSKSWTNIYYTKVNILTLLQQRSPICQLFNLSSKSKSSSLITKPRIFSQQLLIKYLKQVFEQSPSYEQYESNSFAIIPQVNQKYYVFFGSDEKYVPMCKKCNMSIYLNITAEEKGKSIKNIYSNSYNININGINRNNNNNDKEKILKGKLICSNLKCKTKILGEFFINQQNQYQSYSNSNKNIQPNLNNNNRNMSIQKQQQKNNTQQSKANKQELDMKKIMQIKKATMKIIS